MQYSSEALGGTPRDGIVRVKYGKGGAWRKTDRQTDGKHFKVTPLDSLPP